MSNVKIINFKGLELTPSTLNEQAGFEQIEQWQQEGFRHFILDFSEAIMVFTEEFTRLPLVAIGIRHSISSLNGRAIVMKPNTDFMDLSLMLMEKMWNQGEDTDFYWEFLDSFSDISDLLDSSSSQKLSNNIKIVDFSGLTFNPDTFNEHAGFKQIEEWQKEGYRHFVLDLSDIVFMDGVERLPWISISVRTTIRDLNGKAIVIKPQGFLEMYGVFLEKMWNSDDEDFNWIFINSQDELADIFK